MNYVFIQVFAGSRRIQIMGQMMPKHKNACGRQTVVRNHQKEKKETAARREYRKNIDFRRFKALYNI
ncbi:MAG: hypothetical protein MJZ37_08900 [Bacilli bacterium]|nr:hypothetical protein [Bacilli bacterium]